MPQVVSTHNKVYKGRSYGPNNGVYNRSLPFNKRYHGPTRWNGMTHDWENGYEYDNYCRHYDIGILGGMVTLGIEMVTPLVTTLRFMDEWYSEHYGPVANSIVDVDDAFYARCLAQRIYDTMPPGDIKASDNGLIEAATINDLCQYIYINARDAVLMLRAIRLFTVCHKQNTQGIVQYFTWLWEILHNEHQKDYYSHNLFVPGFIGTADEFYAGKGRWEEGYLPLKPIMDLKYFKEFESKVDEAYTYADSINLKDNE